MELDRARPEEYDAVYGMGFDVWGEGLEFDAFIGHCRESPKYARGRWFVAREGTEPVSSLLVHDFDAWEGDPVRGIGSLATQVDRRRTGAGGALLDHVPRLLISEEKAGVVFLYSDIDRSYYEKRGFQVLAEPHQRYQPSVAMACFSPTRDMSFVERNADRLPSYF